MAIVKLISKNQGAFVGVILSVILIVWTFGCESQVKSPVSGNMVTRAELNLEVDIQVKQFETQLDNIQKQAALQFLALDRQDEVKRKLYEFASVTAANNSFNPTGVITLAGSILALGFGVDNRIKDKVIKNRPLPANNNVTST